jgi:hypothetical protein
MKDNKQEHNRESNEHSTKILFFDKSSFEQEEQLENRRRILKKCFRIN